MKFTESASIVVNEEVEMLRLQNIQLEVGFEAFFEDSFK